MTVKAYIDGSFVPDFSFPTYGIYMVDEKGKEYKFNGKVVDPHIRKHRQIAGELVAAVAAVKKAIELGYDTVELYYDYEGIKNFCTLEWKPKQILTKKYNRIMNELSEKIKIKFIKVAAHTGDYGNELADKLAKMAAK